jgi:hypothetical protein
LQREVTTNGGGDFVCADLRTLEGSVPPTDKADLFARAQQNKGLTTTLLQKKSYFKEQLCRTQKTQNCGLTLFHWSGLLLFVSTNQQ